MSKIAINGLSKVFAGGDGPVAALHDVSLNISDQEFVCILGPSGCGKSTLLNIVAGFETATGGECLIGGRPVTGPGPDRGMVFQEYALFPWLTVVQNVEFGLKAAGVAPRERRERAQGLLQSLGLEAFADRFPKDLSGGMRQRVAIARVLALDPAVMLMDEPFGALDALTRTAMQMELLRIWEESRKTVLFITHSVEEAIFLADRIVVMTYRPGTIKTVQTVDLPRPRDATAPAFNELKRYLGQLVMDENRRYQEAELGKTAVAAIE